METNAVLSRKILTRESEKWTKYIKCVDKGVLFGIIVALAICEKHEHSFAVMDDGVACAMTDVECLRAQGVEL